MQNVKGKVIAVIVIIAIGSLAFFVYDQGKNKVSRDLAKRIAELSPRGGPPETIEGLRAAIAAYETQIERNVQEGAQTGVYWKILGIRLADRKMHRDALDAFDRAIRFNAEDPVLFFLTGESASITAASSLGFSPNVNEREYFTNLAQSAYLRAIQLDSTYAKPRLGLGILYTFDQPRPDEAIPHLERYMELSPGNIRGMFVLARAY
jgi:tetratricopeptide (TPR) repeat protein